MLGFNGLDTTGEPPRHGMGSVPVLLPEGARFIPVKLNPLGSTTANFPTSEVTIHLKLAIAIGAVARGYAGAHFLVVVFRERLR
jgi:hypothetical protein